MTSILYFSNFCEHSKKILQVLSKSTISNTIHFICIDNRVKEQDNNTYIILDNGKKIILPETITQVPAFMLLNDNYRVLFGNDIYEHIKPIQQQEIKVETQNNYEPECFSFMGNSCIVSDQYSFIDMDTSAQGDGGMSQLHKYVPVNYMDNISNIPQDDKYSGNSKISKDITIENLQKKRNDELNLL
jgi:hypothetical protein